MLAMFSLAACSMHSRDEHKSGAAVPAQLPSLVHITSSEAHSELLHSLSRAETSLLEYFQNQSETQDFSSIRVVEDKLVAVRVGGVERVELELGKPSREATGLDQAKLERSIRSSMTIAPQTSSDELEELIQAEVAVNLSDRYYFDLLSPEGKTLLILEIPSLYYQDVIRPVLFYRP
ncbi:hypothetical protein [Truepera radiovictrix]|uniref:hypothetical protein n=2 Tax=Truepera radiovictrix TaxID=332249 RepID=UPI001615514A|nr:hypothetical protein [Truepera radiovictrix]